MFVIMFHILTQIFRLFTKKNETRSALNAAISDADWKSRDKTIITIIKAGAEKLYIVETRSHKKSKADYLVQTKHKNYLTIRDVSLIYCSRTTAAHAWNVEQCHREAGQKKNRVEQTSEKVFFISAWSGATYDKFVADLFLRFIWSWSDAAAAWS